MRAAPAVSVPTGGGPLWRALNLALPCLALAVFAAWAARHAGAGTAAAALAALAAVATAGLVLRLWRGARASGSPAGPAAADAMDAPELRFDGSAWTLSGSPGRPEVAIDLQRWLLLRFVSDEPPPRAGSAPPER
ncbi:MAG: hypothetical protein ACK5JG_09275, partial [Pseudomonadota bacterium]